ncbi:MAG TPA: hypothetical protein PLS50_00025 [Candidatus Dojkabacteria bacterium]|nr:hypothetical protein [Candidatus Dojkabacteria bacterium]
MQFGAVTGCCAAYNIYNVGGAHGHTRAKSQEEFEYRFIGKGFQRLNFVITNEYQNHERGFLEKMGFQKQELPGTTLQMHSISGNNLRAYMDKRRLDLIAWKKKKDEEKLKEVEKKSKFNNVLGAAPIPAGDAALLNMVRALLPLLPIGPTTLGRNGITAYTGIVRVNDVERVLAGFTNFRNYSLDIRRILAGRLNTVFSCTNIQIYRYDTLNTIRRRVYDNCYSRRRMAGLI